MIIGQDANGRPVHLTPEMRRQTHMHVIGGSGTGKHPCGCEGHDHSFASIHAHAAPRVRFQQHTAMNPLRARKSHPDLCSFGAMR